MSIDVEKLVEDIAQLRELERSGWLVLEGRITALEQRASREGRSRIVVNQNLSAEPMQVGWRSDVEMISMPVAEWEQHQADLETARLESSTRLALAEVRGLGRDRAERKADDYAAACRVTSEQLEEKRDELRQELLDLKKARRSAVAWANTPIHRLLAAYNQRHKIDSGRGHSLSIVDVGNGWQISWTEWRDGWRMPWSCQRPTLDEACTAAAEQIEAT